MFQDQDQDLDLDLDLDPNQFQIQKSDPDPEIITHQKSLTAYIGKGISTKKVRSSIKYI